MNKLKDNLTKTDNDFIIVKSCGEKFAFKLLEIQEVVISENITFLPGMESSIEGLLNLRGKIVLVLDLAKRLNISCKKEKDKTNYILILEKTKELFGLLTGPDYEIISVEKKQLKPSFQVRIDQSFLRYSDDTLIFKNEKIPVLNSMQLLNL